VSLRATVRQVARESNANRVNVTLDDAHAEKLRRLAERTHVNEGTIARSLLTTALDDADPDPRNVTALLDGIPGAFERAELGLAQVRAGEGKPLGKL
jgi:hypothetical protein